MNPIDWTGPEFLKFYVVALLVAIFLALALRWWLRQPKGESVAGELENSPYETAYLAGGATAAIDSAVVRLIHHGALSLDASSLRLKRKKDAPAEMHPLEEKVYEAVDKETGSLLATVRQNVAKSADKLRGRLDQLGLLIAVDRVALIRFLPALIIVAIAAVGVVKLFVGLERHRPVGFLLVFLGFTIVSAVVLYRLPCFRTRRGDATLDKLKRDNAALEYTAGRRSHALTSDDLVMAIGLFGVGVLAGGPLGYLPTPMRAMPPPRTTSSSTSCSSWFSCSSSSSCGGGGGGGCGGGCGGGGCGGCGG